MADWQVTTRRADGTIRDIAVFHAAADAETRVAFYEAQGFHSEITGPEEMAAARVATDAAEAAGKLRWGPPPFHGHAWDRAWNEGPGGEP
jgi:hypothetical protein